MNDTKHSANFLASRFLTSKICLKKIYNLKSCHVSIIRYICDSIDFNFSKRKKFENKIYQSQIAKFTFLSRKTVNIELQHLAKKRIIKYISKNTFTVGQTLIACNLRLQSKEVLRIVTRARSVTSGYTSNSSNFTNKLYASHSEKPKASEPKQTTKFWEPGNPDYDRFHE